MIGLIIMILLSALIAGDIKEELEDAFSDPNWLSFDEPMSDRGRLEMENTEWPWGHNIKNYMED